MAKEEGDGYSVSYQATSLGYTVVAIVLDGNEAGAVYVHHRLDLTEGKARDLVAKIQYVLEMDGLDALKPEAWKRFVVDGTPAADKEAG